MCGRYALSLPAGAVRMHIENELERPVAAWEDEEDYNPARGYNIAPRTRNPIILRGGASHEGATEPKDDGNHDEKKKEDEQVLRIENMQWGLIPHWMKRAPDTSSMLKTINAREDTIIEGGSMWKSIRGRKRCVVVAEGFYEWLHKGTERIPHFIKRKDGKLLCLAGLWDSVTYEGEKKPLHTYTIVTVDANKQMSWLHNRMPAILPDAHSVATWLDTSDGTWSKEVAGLLKPFEGELEIYPVPKEVGKVGTQSSDYLRPVSERKGNIASFFAKQTVKNEEEKKHSHETASPEVKKKEMSPDDVQAEELAEVAKEGQELEGKETASAQRRSKSPPVKVASSSAKPDPEDIKPASKGKASRRNKQEANEMSDPVQTDLPLNPDEGDDIAKASPHNLRSRKGKEKPIVLDDESDNEAGDSKKDPILLDDLKSSSDVEPKNGSAKRKRKSTGKAKVDAAETPAPKRKRRASSERPSKIATSSKNTIKSNAKSRAATKPSTDNEGNEKLENYFQIEDDSS